MDYYVVLQGMKESCNQTELEVMLSEVSQKRGNHRIYHLSMIYRIENVM